MEMKKQHFDHTKGYIKALDAAYMKIRKLEAENEDTKGDGEEEEDMKNKETRDKGKEVEDVFDEDKITSIDALLKRIEIVEAVV
jgi:hypothetical protein